MFTVICSSRGIIPALASLVGIAFSPLASGELPAWWSEGNPPVLDDLAPVNDRGPANIGQAKFMAIRALEAIGNVDQRISEAIKWDAAMPEAVSYGVPEPKPENWEAQQYAALNIGQLKAIAEPFYRHLHTAFPEWLDNDSLVESEKGQLQFNQTKDASDPSNFYPWTSNLADDQNFAIATVGQLKAVFCLRFETLDTDYDDDGLTNNQEIQLHGTDPSNADTDGDGVSDSAEITAGTNPLLPPPSPELLAFANGLTAAVTSRVDGKTPSDSTRHVFSSKDHAIPSYVRNANLWCADLVPQLTGCAAWKTYWNETLGGVMITRRHILFCQHQHPKWDQPPAGTLIRFVKVDGTVVERTLIANVDAPNNVDLCVGLLDQDVPEGIHVVPIMPPFSAIQKGQLGELKVPDLAVSQAGSLSPGVSNESRVYSGIIYQNLSIPPPPLSDWLHFIYPGDSGTPRFLVTTSGLCLYMLTGASSVNDNISLINSLISACDASAMARGVLAEPTGKTVTVADIVIPTL